MFFSLLKPANMEKLHHHNIQSFPGNTNLSRPPPIASMTSHPLYHASTTGSDVTSQTALDPNMQKIWGEWNQNDLDLISKTCDAWGDVMRQAWTGGMSCIRHETYVMMCIVHCVHLKLCKKIIDIDFKSFSKWTQIGVDRTLLFYATSYALITYFTYLPQH